ncbi:MAG: hypothetical protein R3Y63_00180 [Eubacteriales bacterium]
MEWTTKMEGGGLLYLRDEGNYMYLEATRPSGQEGLYKVILHGMLGKQILGTMTPSDTGLKLSRMVSRSTLGQWGCLPITKVVCQLSFPFEEKKLPYPTTLSEKEEGQMDIIVEASEEKNSSALSTNSLEEIILPAVQKIAEFFPAAKEANVPEEKNLSQDESWEAVPDELMEAEEGYRPCPRPQRWMKDAVLENCFRRCKDVLVLEKMEGFTLAIPYSTDKEFPLTPIFCFGEMMEYKGKSYLLFSFQESGVPCIFP